MSKKSLQPQFPMGTIVPEILMNDHCCKNNKQKNRNKKPGIDKNHLHIKVPVILTFKEGTDTGKIGPKNTV